MTTAIYAGSFDPIHVGHVSVLSQAVYHFDKVILLLANNPEKSYMFSVMDRMRMMRRVAEFWPNVSWNRWEGLLRDFIEEEELNTPCVSIRGARNANDFEYEHTMANINYRLGVQTIIYPATIHHEDVSSSAVRQLIKLHAPIDTILNMIPTGNSEHIRKMWEKFDVH
jgi:pantetheine-phosphate adenylyltransferase